MPPLPAGGPLPFEHQLFKKLDNHIELDDSFDLAIGYGDYFDAKACECGAPRCVVGDVVWPRVVFAAVVLDCDAVFGPEQIASQALLAGCPSERFRCSKLVVEVRFAQSASPYSLGET